MKTPCKPVSEAQARQIRKMNELKAQWTNPRFYKNISKRFDSYDSAEIALKDLAQEWIGLPFSEDFHLSDVQWNKIYKLSEWYNKDLGREWSDIKGIVPEGVSLQDPTGRRFHLEYNQIRNYERNYIAKNEHMSAITSNYLKEAYLNDKDLRFSLGNKAVREVRKLQSKLLTSDSEADKLRYMQKLEDFIKSNDGKIIGDFTALMELDDIAFAQAGRRLKRQVFHKDPETGLPIKTQDIDLNQNTINAAKNARAHLKEMGGVLTDGIDKMKQLVDTKYDSILGDKENNTYRNLIKNLNEAKARIKAGIEEGGYLPRYLIESVIDMKYKTDQLMNAKDKTSTQESINLISDVLTSINSGRDLDVMKPRNEMLNNVYNKDPLFVIQQYGKEVVAYNKLATMQNSYLKAMRNIPDSDLKFVNGLKKFITEQYTVATKGLGDRPQWVNDITRTISALQIARTMGLNFTGAIKNTSSAVYFVAEMGRKNLKKASHLVKHDDDVKEALKLVEKEQGFVFPDISRDLIADGLLPSEGINKSDFDYDPMSGKITYQGNDIRNQFEQIQNATVDNLLIFHRQTENLTRNWMFRMSFASKYKELKDHPEYMRNIIEKEGGKNIETAAFQTAEARRFAKNYAVKMVNMYAYEYAIHAKSKYIRGQSFKVDEAGENIIVANNKYLSGMKGAAQQLAFQLMHYPMSLLQTHQRKYKGAKLSIASGEKLLDSNDVMFWARYGGLFGSLAVTSVAMNLDLSQIVDNDLYRRVGDLHDIFMSDEDDETKQYGLLGQFTGPSVGHLTFALQMADIINTEESKMQEIMFGNVNYDDPEEAKYKWYQLGTFPGQVANKLWPALKNGTGADVTRHLFKQYSSPTVKKYNEKFYKDILGVRKSKVKKKTKFKNIDEQILLQSLDRLKGL